MLVLRELRLHGLLQADGLARDDVHQRAALAAGEDGGVYLLSQLLFAEDDGSARTAQGLVRRRRDDVGVRHGRGVRPAGYKAADMGHVHEHIGPDLVAYLAYLSPVDDAGIGGGAGDYHLRAQLLGHAEHLVIVDELRLGVHAVAVDVEVFAGYGGPGAVGEVAAAGEVHTHEHVPGLRQGEIDGNVRLGAGVRLHVGMLSPEELLGPVAADVLHYIHIFTAAVKTLAGVALGVFIREMAADGLHDRRRGEVFRGDKLYMVALPRELLLHCGKDLRVLAAYVLIIHDKTAPRPVFFPLCLRTRYCIIPPLRHIKQLQYRRGKRACVCSFCTNVLRMHTLSVLWDANLSKMSHWRP